MFINIFKHTCILGHQRTRWLNGITSASGHELGQTSGADEGQGGLVCSSPWGHKESNMTGFPCNPIVPSKSIIAYIYLFISCPRLGYRLFNGSDFFIRVYSPEWLSA